MAVLKLVLADVWQRRTRAILTVVSIALAVSLVAGVTSGYSSIRATVMKYFLEYIGRTDVEIRKQQGELKQDVVYQLLADREVAHAVGRLEVKTSLVDGNGKPLDEPAMATFIGVKLPGDIEAANLQMEPGTQGQWFSGDSGDFAVIDQRVAELLKVNVGDTILLPAISRSPTDDGAHATTTPANAPLRLKVVAIVHKPQIATIFSQTVYVPLRTLQDFTGNRGMLSRVLVDLKPGVSDGEFVARWRPKYPWLKMKPASESRKQVDQHMQSIEMLSYLGGTVSMAAATFIVFSTLSMGVVERQRALGMLRAVGAVKGQIARMVVLEGAVLAIVGAGVGLPLGLLWVKLMAMYRPDYFQAGIVPSLGGMLYGGVGMLVAALAASLLPALSASRTSPIEAMTVAGQPASPSGPWIAAAAGLALAMVDPLLLFGPKVFGNRGVLSDAATYYAHFFVGVPCLLVGFFLLAPACVWIVEKTLGYTVSALLGIRHSLLAQQLSGHIWRSAGTAAALMVGLAIFVVLHTQGNSLLSSWKIPKKFPDIFIFSMSGIKPADIKSIEEIPGIYKNQVLPIAFDRNRVFQAMTPFGGDTSMFFGIDPEKGLEMMQLEFLEGDKDEAVKLLSKGRYVIITDELRQLRGLHKGDKIQFKGSFLGKDPPPYTIAGVVWSPAIDVFVSQFDMMQQFEERSVGSAFGTLEDARRDFGIDTIHLIAANLDWGPNGQGVDKILLKQRIQQVVGASGLVMGDVRQIKVQIVAGFERLIWLMSSVALAATIVAAFGVANTVIASIRSRRWQLGVLRSVGLTRGQLLRLILGESLLLGLVACVLGVAAGLQMSLDANRFGWWVVGYQPPVEVPWNIVWTGVAIILAVALFASLWPAVATARKQPLELLQGGRAGA